MSNQFLLPAVVTTLGMTLAACGFKPNDVPSSHPDASVTRQAAMNSMNSMNARNSMNSMNGLNSMNSMNAQNGLNSMNSMNGLNSMNSMNVLQPMNAISSLSTSSAMSALTAMVGADGLVLGGSMVAPPDSLDSLDFSTMSPDTIDQLCPYTSWTVFDKARGVNIQYTLPKFMVFMNLFEKVTVSTCSGGLCGVSDLVVNVDNGTGPQGLHHVYSGFAIACANLVVRPAFLAPDPPPAVDSQGNRVIRPYEQDFDYFCLEFSPAGARGFWYCATGNLADGVTGIASKPSAIDVNNTSPATFFLNQIQWGPNVWNKHWEFPQGLGAVSARIPAKEQTGFAKDYQWNLNPNDWHADHSSKARDYIAAIAVKTATNRNGVNVSPYNTRHVYDYLRPGTVNPPLDTVGYAALVDPGELNQAEVEKRSCGTGDPSLCFSYFNKPDVASTGNIGTAGYGVVDLSVGPYYVNNRATCSWMDDWSFPALSTFTGGNVVPPPPVGGMYVQAVGQSNTPATMVNSDFTVALNLGDNEMARCPTWSLCETSGPQPTLHLYGEDSGRSVLRVFPTNGVRFSANQPDATVCNNGAYYWCKQILCGRQIKVESNDGSARDWYVRAVPSGQTAGSWQPGCTNTPDCSITVDGNLSIVGIPSGIDRATVLSTLATQVLP